VNIARRFQLGLVAAAGLGILVDAVACRGSTGQSAAAGGSPYCSHLADFARSQVLDCIAGPINAATPTPAHEQVKSDFCKICPDGASPVDSRSCSNFFSYPGFAQTGGAGYLVSVVSDGVAAQMGQRCISASGDCALGFIACSEMIFGMSTNTPPACNNGGSVTGLFVRPRIR
jgi:hypothetical protein